MTQLGKYDLHEQIGKGSFGTVYRATDTALRIGSSPSRCSTRPPMMSSLNVSARGPTGRWLRKPTRCHHYEIGEEHGRVFHRHALLPRRQPGGSNPKRSSFLGKGRSDPYPDLRRVEPTPQARLGAPRLETLATSCLTPRGEPWWPISGQTRVLTATGSSSSGTGAGTPYYRAPELWRGKPPASPATDIYSLGCILAEMLTGKTPFGGDTPDEVLAKHLIDGPQLALAGLYQMCRKG